MLSQLFRFATLAKGAVALSLITGAYGAATTNLADQRPIVASAHMDFTNQVTPTPKPISRRETREGTTQTEVTNPAVDPLVRECVTKYARIASFKDAPSAEREGAGRLVKEVCERAMKASGLEAGAFWAKYRSQFGTTKNEETKRPDANNKGQVDPSFEGLLKECATKYLRLVSSKEMPAAEREEAGRLVRDVCERAIKASGLEAGPFWAKYARYMTPTTKLEQTTSPKPSASPKPIVTDPLVRECYAKYQELATLRSGAVEAYEAAVRAFNENCRRVLEASHN